MHDACGGWHMDDASASAETQGHLGVGGPGPPILTPIPRLALMSAACLFSSFGVARLLQALAESRSHSLVRTTTPAPRVGASLGDDVNPPITSSSFNGTA